METTKTFAEGPHSFWCIVREVPRGVFVCAITFASNPVVGPLQTMDLKMDGAFASNDIAMGAAECYGRAMIRKHGDVVGYLANQGALDE